MLLGPPFGLRCHLPRQKPSRPSPKMPKTHPGRRVRLSLSPVPKKQRSSRRSHWHTQISSRLMVVLYQTLSPFWQSRFPTETVSHSPQNKKSNLSTTMAQQPQKSRPPLLSRTPRWRQSRARSPRYPLLIRYPPHRLLIPRKARTRQSRRQQRGYQLSLARGRPMRRSGDAGGGSCSSTRALRGSSPGSFFWASLSFPVHLPETRGARLTAPTRMGPTISPMRR